LSATIGDLVGPGQEEIGAAQAGRSNRQLVWARLRRDPTAVVSMTILAVLIFAATIGAPLAAHLTGHPPNTPYNDAVSARGIPIGVMQHPYYADGTTPNPHATVFVLGADSLGRDQFVRVLYGARVSLIVAFGATGVALIIGISLGLLAGYCGGWVDAVIARMIETAIAFPSLLMAIALAVVVGPGLLNVLVVIALFTWFYPARIVRSVALSGKDLLYVQAARTVGARPRRLLLVHILPQAWGPLLVFGTSIVANNILFEASLSYLGIGVPAPTASWGQMLSDAINSGFYRINPSMLFVPGVALVSTMLAFNLLGDSLRDALDPKARR
jgi:ABC-type dipeptide/oligopeptide/nickel transport system permease subunit